MDVESLAKQLILQNMTPEQQNAVLESVRASLLEARSNQKRRVSENVGMVVDALKKIEADIRAKYDDLGNKIETRVNSIKDGRDGIDGRDGKDGKDGRPGRDGATGPMGPAGRDGRDGVDGEDGVSVTDAKIDFDGSLVISLSNGREINVGEVMSPDAVERIRILTYAGDNSGGGGGSSGLTYKGTWDASTNTPLIISSAGTNGDYYIVSVAGSTDINGITDWQAGDWLIFNGTVWQKIDQSWATAGTNNNITSMTGITGGISSPDFIQFDTGATVTNAAGRLYWDATQQTLTVGLNANIAADVGQTLYAYATNDEAVTINKGQPVYMFAAQGDRVSVKLAYNTGDATSAKTLGICAENIAAGQAGMILCQGVQDGLDLSAYSAGDTLYLGATAGTLTNVKPYAPNHLVYIGVVERANAGNGRLYVRVQNGYEMDELHNVSAQTPADGHVLIYNDTTDLWESHTLTDGTGITITEGAGSITITNSAPDQTVSLTGAGTTSISGTYPNFTITSNDQYVGTVTSVGGTGTVNGISLSGTVTSSGSLTLGGTLSNIDNSSLTNSSVTIGSTSVSLGSTATTVSGLTLSSPTVSGGTIDNASVGATTPSTGAFTSLSATGVTTVQAGTAAAPAITTSGDTNTGVFFPSADTVAIGTGGTERLRVDSAGNVGVGQSTPSNPLHIYAASAPQVRIQDANGSFYVGRDSSNNALLNMAQAYAMIFQTSGTERARITSDGNFQFNSGYGSVATAYGCRAWVNFNGTGTVAIRASGNVTSITDNGTGSYTVNIDVDMPDENYAVTIATSRADFIGGTNGLPTAGAFNVNTRNGTNAQVDTAGVFAAVFR